MSCVRKGRGHQPTGKTEQVVGHRAGGSGFARRIPTGGGVGGGKNHLGKVEGRGGDEGGGGEPEAWV